MVQQEPLAGESYFSSSAEDPGNVPSPLTRGQMKEALNWLSGEFGPQCKGGRKPETHILSAPGLRKTVLASTTEALERDTGALPLSPISLPLRGLAEQLTRSGERLPMVIGSCERGAFRRSVVYWVGTSEVTPIESLEQVLHDLEAWNGEYPDPAIWVGAEKAARQQAELQVSGMEERAVQREQAALRSQLAAVRIRLQRELGRYLVCLGHGTANLNDIFFRQMSRDIASRERLGHCFKKLGGYPDWPPELLRDLQEFINKLSDNQRRARLLGTEIDAALEDPRWAAALQE
jgi:hypothetical protein